jgi:uncharacterized membrane protein
VLCLAALVWVALHIGLAGTRLRDAAVVRLGENGFRGGFSVLSLASLVLLVLAWRAAPKVLLWQAPAPVQLLFLAVMLVACFLLVASVAGPNPTMAGPAVGPAYAARGIQRVTRHPMLWAFALWAGVHMAAAGSIAALVFFGAFLVTALAGMPSIDAKLARRDPLLWRTLSATTSIVPGAAIASGRNRFVAAEIAWPVWAGAAALFIALLALHHPVLGVSPLP